MNHTEAVNLSPSGEVLVCAGQDRLAFVCTTNQTFIEWNVTLVLTSGERISRTRLVTSDIQVSLLVVNTKLFNITLNGSMPLTTSGPVNDLNSRDNATTSIATVYIIEPGNYYK